MREFVMPEYILGELCERLQGVSVTGGLVAAEDPPRPEDVLETTELTLLRALVAAGGEADRRELERVCLASGMKASSFNNRIAYSPIVTDLGHGRYGLRGRRAIDGERAGVLLAERTAAVDGVPRPGDLASFRRLHRR
jgi:hypothetical protein